MNEPVIDMVFHTLVQETLAIIADRMGDIEDRQEMVSLIDEVMTMQNGKSGRYEMMYQLGEDGLLQVYPKKRLLQ